MQHEMSLITDYQCDSIFISFLDNYDFYDKHFLKILSIRLASLID